MQLVSQLMWAAIGCRSDVFPRATALSCEISSARRPVEVMRVSEEASYAGLEAYWAEAKTRASSQKSANSKRNSVAVLCSIAFPGYDGFLSGGRETACYWVH